MEITVVPHRIPKVLVVSHERSGTHFLMNSLADNLGYISKPWIDVDWPQVKNPFASSNFKNFLGQFYGKGVLNTFKCHFSADFLMDIMDYLTTEFQVFYVYRDMPATMESLCNHIKGFSWFMGPDVKDGEVLRLTQPCGALLRYQANQFDSILSRWKYHVRSWTRGLTAEHRARIIYVRYKDLNEQFDRTVKKIGDRLGCYVTETVRPSRGDRVVTTEEAFRHAG